MIVGSASAGKGPGQWDIYRSLRREAEQMTILGTKKSGEKPELFEFKVRLFDDFGTREPGIVESWT